MLFIVFNLVLFVASVALTYSGFTHHKLFLELPASLEILIVIGLVTPIMNLYDTIQNFQAILSGIKGSDDEESM